MATAHDLRESVIESRRRQGLPPKIVDVRALAVVADLLCASTNRAGSKAKAR